MKAKLLPLVVFILLLPLALQANEGRQLPPCSASWAVDTSGFWDVASNWDANAVPGPTDDVCIDRPGVDITVTHRTGSSSINSLHSQEAIVISFGSLTVATASEISNVLTLSSGTLTGNGDITVSGLFTWTGGTLGGNGALNTNGGMVISASASPRTIDGRTLNINAGAVTWTGGNFSMTNGAVINVAAGALFDAQGDNTISRSGPVGTLNTVNNAGTFRKSAGSGTTTLLGMVFNNSGAVEVQSGTLRLQGGSFVVDAGTTLEVQGQTLEASSNVTGAGTVRIVAASTGVGGDVTNIHGAFSPGVTEIAGGTANFASGQATVTVTGTGFSPSTTVSLFSADRAQRQAARVLFRNGNTLFATFDLTGLATGVYDLRADDGAATSAATGAFRVTDGPPGQLTFDLMTPARVTARRPEGPTIITCANTGETDIPAPVFRLDTDNQAYYNQVQRPLQSTQPHPGGSGAVFTVGEFGLRGRPRPTPELQFLGVNRAGAAGVLPPGAKGQIIIGFGTDRRAAGPPPLRFQVALLESPNEPFDWNAVKDDARPETIPADAWEAIFASWVTRVGGNLAGYERALDEAATYLSQLGQTTDDVELLLAFIFNQLDNAYPGSLLAPGADAAEPAPGLPVTLLRAYTQPITDRYHLGAFGRGWRHPYEMTIQMIDPVPPSFPGRIAVGGPGGTRFFEQVAEEPDSNGATLWRGIYGDPGVVLAKLGFGTPPAIDSAVLFEPDGTAFHFEGADGGKLSFIEDMNGNRITLEYTAGRLTGIVHSNGDRLTLDYNANGRVRQLTDFAGRTTTYTYDAAGEHLDRVDGPFGSTAGLTGADGSYVNSYSYLPFGEPLAVSESFANPFAYVGRFGVMREGNGLDYMRARYYSPEEGRFITEDPIKLSGGLNLYAYVGNDPVSLIDPSGLITFGELAEELGTMLEEASGKPKPRPKPAQPSPGPGTVGPNDPTVVRERTNPREGTIYRDTKPCSCPAHLTKARRFATGAMRGAARIVGKALPVADAFLTGWDVGRYLDEKFNLGEPAMGFWGDLACDLVNCSGDPDDFGDTNIVTSVDPNDIIGPAGFGPEGFIQPDQVLPYTIRFENLAAATAPAQTVVITQQLDPDLDFTSFELGDFGFGGLVAEVEEGHSFLSGRIDQRDSHGVFLDVTADFDANTGLLTWPFTSLDPATFDLPLDPDAGFLPPNQTPPEGEGFVSYRVRPKEGLATGTRFDARATSSSMSTRPWTRRPS